MLRLISTTQAQNQMQSGFLLYVVVTEGSTIFQLLASEDQSLLVWGDAFFVLNLGLYILNGIRGLYV